MKPKVLIVEDEPGIADTLQYALRTEGFEPAWCATGEAALAHARSDPPALVILDVGLPDASGFEIFKRLRATSDVPVVFLTARSDEIDRVVGLELGADDYVAKPFSPRELVARVRGVLRRTARAAGPGDVAAPTPPGTPADVWPGAGGAARSQTPTPIATPTPTPTSPIDVDEGRMRIRYYGRPLELSRYEFGLLRTLASRPGHVFSRDALLERVWGNDTESMDRTVDAHVKTLRAKMKAIAPQQEPIRTLRGSGYALAEDLPPTPS
ncbi:MAG TPA: response regulator [Caldimonas sp.]|jgi:two-component system catabolic regulation response regulator CreB|nr:response regulator [Caldimonas sp.]HEX2543139.1 response regulator [Caldimonas sp.]